MLRLYVKRARPDAPSRSPPRRPPPARAGSSTTRPPRDGAYAVLHRGRRRRRQRGADARHARTRPRSVTLTARADRAAPDLRARSTVGTAGDADARMVNNGEATLTLPRPATRRAATSRSSADACTGATLAPGDECALRLRFAPTAAGTRTARLSVRRRRARPRRRGRSAPVVLPAPPPPPPPAAAAEDPARRSASPSSTAGKSQTRICARSSSTACPTAPTVVAKLGKQNDHQAQRLRRARLAEGAHQQADQGRHEAHGHGHQVGHGHHRPDAHHAGPQDPAGYDELSSSRPSSSSSTVQSPSGRGSSSSPRSRTATKTDPRRG